MENQGRNAHRNRVRSASRLLLLSCFCLLACSAALGQARFGSLTAAHARASYGPRYFAPNDAGSAERWFAMADAAGGSERLPLEPTATTTTTGASDASAAGATTETAAGDTSANSPAEAPAATTPAAPTTATTTQTQQTTVAPAPASCNRTIKASVVAFDQLYTYNRFGAFNPAGMMYALTRDVEKIDSTLDLGPGNVRLKTGKRPRPIVLRANEGDCLQITFT
ncbi:MAG TPA: hypothetical protein VE775_09285, partial [Pyrinomonadaceae bacterium]|nr:hypothetical protein [Pyrinomonadaceae bacterium]